MRYVHRVYVRHKRGDLEKVLELAREGAKLFPSHVVIRHFASDVGPPSNTFVYELEFASYADLETEWKAFNELEEVPDLVDRWYAVVEDVKSEVWEMYDLPE